MATPQSKLFRSLLPIANFWGRLSGRELSITGNSLVLSFFFFVSAGMGVIRQALFNAQFGVGPEVDAYYAAFRLPNTLFNLIAGGTLSSAMIPILLTTRQEDGDPAGERLVNIVLTTLLAFFAVLVIGLEFLAPLFVRHILAPGFDPGRSNLTITLTRIMLLQPLILAVGSVAAAVLNSRNQFFLTSLATLGHNVALITAIVACRFRPELGILAPTVAVVIGAGLQVALLLPALRHQQKLSLIWSHGDYRLKQMIRLLIPNALSAGVNYGGSVADIAFASQTSHTAGIPAINNAMMLINLPISLLGQAVGLAAFPRLAAHAAANQWSAMRRTLLGSLMAALALTIPIVLAFWAFGRPLIRILFERGNFGAPAGDLTAQVLVIYALALPAYISTEIVARALVSMRDTTTPLLTNSLQLLGRIALLSLLIEQQAILAIPIAFAITATLETLLLTCVLLLKLQVRLNIK